MDTVTTLQKQHMDIIHQMLSNSEALYPKLFNDNDEIYPYIYQQLMNMTNFVCDMFFPFFPNIKVLDIVMTGSMCGYTYTKHSDLDILIIIEDLCKENSELNNNILDKLSILLANQSWKPNIFGHLIDFGFIVEKKYMRFYHEHPAPQRVYSYGTYSLLENKWVYKPIYNKYPFSVHELYQFYINFKNKLDNTVNKLPRIDEKHLTPESIIKLKKIISNLKSEAFFAREHDPLHQYSKVYNIFRVAKRLKLFAKYYDLINKSNAFIASQKNKKL